MAICITCEKDIEACKCGVAAQKRLQKLVAERKAKFPDPMMDRIAEQEDMPGPEDLHFE